MGVVLNSRHKHEESVYAYNDIHIVRVINKYVFNHRNGLGRERGTICKSYLSHKLRDDKGIDAVYDIAHWLMTKAWKVNVRGNNVNIYDALYVKPQRDHENCLLLNGANGDVNNTHNNNNTINVDRNIRSSISHKDIGGKVFQEKQYDELSLQEYLNKEVQELKRSQSQTIFKENHARHNNNLKYQTPNASMRRDFYYNNSNNYLNTLSSQTNNNTNDHSSLNYIYRNPLRSNHRNNKDSSHLNTVSRSFKNINYNHTSNNVKVVKHNKPNTQYASFRNTNKVYQKQLNNHYYDTLKPNRKKYYNVFVSTSTIKNNKVVSSLTTLNSFNLNQHRNNTNSFYTPEKMVPSRSKCSMKSFNNVHSQYSAPNTGRDKRNIRKKMYYKSHKEEAPMIHRIVIDLREVIKDG